MEVKTVLLMLHVLGVAFGLGGAVMLDIYLLKLLRGREIGADDVTFVAYVSRFVQAGLGLLWLSGVAIVLTAGDGPFATLANPKLQAKIAIVVVLTLNAVVIETHALPLVRRQQGRCLFDGVGERLRTVLLGSAAVSATSWVAPFVLGLARELNGAVPALTILAVYGGALVVTVMGAQILGRALYQPLYGGSTVTLMRFLILGGLARLLGRAALYLIEILRDVPVPAERGLSDRRTAHLAPAATAR